MWNKRTSAFQIHIFVCFLSSARKTLLYEQNDLVICLPLSNIKNGIIIKFHRNDVPVLLKVLPWRRSHYLLFQWRYCVRKTQQGEMAGCYKSCQRGRKNMGAEQSDCMVDQVIMKILEGTTSSKPDFVST
jgi:hypothetical protein